MPARPDAARRPVRADTAAELLLGPHVSVAGGLERAFANGEAVGASAIQVFTRNQRQWQTPALREEEVRAFRGAWAQSGIRAVMSHASYLLNLGSPEAEQLARSRALLAEEVQRCLRLGIPLLTFHPGASLGEDTRGCLRRIAESLAGVLPLPADTTLQITLENTAGQGTVVGKSLEELAEILDAAAAPEGVGICLDTCHLFAAGYDIADDEGWARFWERFEILLGRRRLKALHVNDAQQPLGSRRDRHARLGAGYLGWDFFRRLARDPRLRGLPWLLETPGGEPVWKREIRRLRNFARTRD